MKILLAIFISITVTLAAHADDSYYGVAGEVWKMLDAGKKDIYLIGLKDGYWTFGQEASDAGKDVKFECKMLWSVNRKVVLEALDKFYEEPQNYLVPVPVAITSINMQMKGVPQEKVSEFLSVERSLAYDNLQKNKARQRNADGK